MAPIKACYILRNLAQLSASLEAKNIPLKILNIPKFDQVPASLVKLAKAHSCDELHHNREYEVNEQRRDAAVRSAFHEAGLAVHSYTDQCLFEPGEILTKKGTPYTIFTPFKRTLSEALEADRSRLSPLPAPRKRTEMPTPPDPIPDRIKGFTLSIQASNLYPAGEKAAHASLKQFIKKRLRSYQDQRDIPALEATSVLSPLISIGVLSLRQCVSSAADANEGNLASGSPGALKWIEELAWREFSKHIIAHLSIKHGVKHFLSWFSNRI